MRIILASASPRRREILTRLGYKFDVILPSVQEITVKKRPSAMVKELAFKKTFDVARLYPDAVVIGGDTLVYCKGRVIGKPKNKADALRILRLENGSWQAVYSGIAIICKNQNKAVTGVERTLCKARRLDDKALSALAGKHMDKAGAYAMQDNDDIFIERIKGCYDNVVGMPSALLNEMMKEFKK
jgi:septum formation protein